MRLAPAATLLLCSALAAAAAPAARAGPQLTPIATFDAPVYVAAAPDDPHRLYVVEQGGAVRVVRDGEVLDEPFLDLSGAVGGPGGEGGLASIAFAPDYARSGRLYAFYTAPRPGDPAGNVLTVDELRRSGDPDRADPASRRTVIEVDHPESPYHNGGQLQFGPDGHLYVSVGDGSAAPDSAQDTELLLGKLLRIDPDAAGGAPYAVPAGNPFVGAPGRDEIYALGLRNPWRFSFDRGSGDLIVADPGHETREEIDFAPGGEAAGANYGWPCWEGRLHRRPECDPPGYAAPVFDYGRPDGSCSSIIGGYVVRDPDLPSLAGRYLYGDYCFGRLRSVVPAAPDATGDAPVGIDLQRYELVSFGEDSCGHVYVVAIVGEVSRIDERPFTPCSEQQQAAPPAEPRGEPDPAPGERVGEPPPPDLAAPVVRLRRATRQSALRNRALTVGVRCDELCGVTASATIAVPGASRVYRSRKVRRPLAARTSVKLRLKLPAKARRAISRALARRARVRARIAVVARDGAGNERSAAVHVVVQG